MKHTIAGRHTNYVPMLHDMRNVGRQSWDDVLAANAEPLPRYLATFDYASIELRVMRPLLGWRWYLRHILPVSYLYKVVNRG